MALTGMLSFWDHVSRLMYLWWLVVAHGLLHFVHICTLSFHCMISWLCRFTRWFTIKVIMSPFFSFADKFGDIPVHSFKFSWEVANAGACICLVHFPRNLYMLNCVETYLTIYFIMLIFCVQKVCWIFSS